MKAQIQQPLSKCAKLYADYAEKLGFLPVGQFYAIKSQLADDGAEWPIPIGPLRYTKASADRDALESGGAFALVFVVRYCDPNDPEDMRAYGQHQKDALAERGAA